MNKIKTKAIHIAKSHQPTLHQNLAKSMVSLLLKDKENGKQRTPNST